MSTIIEAPVVTFNAKTLASTFANVKNRALQVRHVGVAIEDVKMTPSELYEVVNAAYGAANDGEVLSKSALSSTAVANLVNTFKLAVEYGFAAQDKHVAKALNVIEKGQAVALDEFRESADELDVEDDGYLGAIYRFLVVANERALELRKASKSTPSVDNDSEGDEGDEGDKPVESLVTVILRNVAALDVPGCTDEELDALDQMLDSLMGRVIKARDARKA